MEGERGRVESLAANGEVVLSIILTHILDRPDVGTFCPKSRMADGDDKVGPRFLLSTTLE